jgi:LuxR family transcriptional regulator, maltose regulon positive regulatory protein
MLRYSSVPTEAVNGFGPPIPGPMTPSPAGPMRTPPAPRGAAGEPEASKRGLVDRHDLSDRVADVGPGRVVLVCAPAGSGKTVLLHAWAEAAGWERVAWVSVERDERDAQRFWLSVVNALADLGAEGQIERYSPSPGFRADSVVARLLDDLDSLTEPAFLVIDDLHELASDEALKSLEMLLGQLPEHLGVVLATREQPRVGLHRLRLGGALTELRGPDLRFSPEEARALLRAAGVELSDEAHTLLYDRTEGWAAGLRLAAISLAAHPEPERFVSEFSGSERTVAGYLLEEVLERQPPETRELLLRTSVLDRVCGSLADALTGGSGSEAILQQLEEANAFITSLDASRSWFRYHHLFSDLLRLELRRLAPHLLGTLHSAAAHWLEEHARPLEAIRHAQAARDWSHASRLLADHQFSLILEGGATTRALLAAFPVDVVAQDGELALACATSTAFDGALEEAEAYVAVAENRAASVPEDRRWHFDLRLATVRLLLARRGGDVDAAIEQLQHVDAALSAQHEPQTVRDRAVTNDVRAVALMNLGIAQLWSLRLKDARRHLEDALARARRAHRPYLEVGCLAHLAMIIPLSGGPVTDALRLTEEAVAVADQHGWAADPVVAPALAIGGNILVRLGRFEEAEDWLERAARALGPGEPGTEMVLHSALGVLRLGQGRAEEALEALRDAQQAQACLAAQHALAIEAQSRMMHAQVKLGDIEAARQTLAGLPAEVRNRAGKRIVAAAIELADGDAQGALDAASAVIEQDVPALHASWGAIEALLFAAAAHEELGERRAAEESIERALELAEPEGMILPFAIAPVRELLERHPRHRTAHPTLIATIFDMLDGSASRPPDEPEPLAEELSCAELRVLRFLPTNLKAPEIAAEIFVSTNTVRTHLRHIYSKLDVHSRTDAVARARQLRLLSPGARAH